MAEVVSTPAPEAAAADTAPPPMAVAYAGAPVATSLPPTAFPGMTDASNPVMAACHAAWNELVAMVGPDFVNQVSGEGAE
eukprot:12618179-Alexandrium_andersonii.AAC.1